MPTRNVSLPVALDTFVDQAIQSGRFDSASEVVRAGLRLLEQEDMENQAKLSALKSLITEGASGNFDDADIVFARLRQRIKDKAAIEEGSSRCETLA